MHDVCTTILLFLCKTESEPPRDFYGEFFLCRHLNKNVFKSASCASLNRYLSVYKDKTYCVTGVLVLFGAIIFDVECNHCDELGLESLQTSALNRLRVVKQHLRRRIFYVALVRGTILS